MLEWKSAGVIFAVFNISKNSKGLFFTKIHINTSHKIKAFIEMDQEVVL